MFSWPVSACSAAAEHGQLETLQWLRSQSPPCPWSDDTCAAAAQSGQFEILQWLRSQSPPCPWCAFSCLLAAKYGHLRVLQWLRSQSPPCPWSADTCTATAVCGQFEILQWLRSQDPPCPWNEDFCMTAKAQRHDVLGWALLHGCPVQQPFLKMLRTRLLFLTCIAHQQNSCMLDGPACTFRSSPPQVAATSSSAHC